MTRSLVDDFVVTRQCSIELCQPLAIEDYGVQAMIDASPPKWHLAHTTWFFETFILKPHCPSYQVFNPLFEYLFNSYYNGVGRQFSRDKRGSLSRPTVAEIQHYRQQVDAAMLALLVDCQDSAILQKTVLGLHHEQQHQELLVTDLKYNFGHNPLYPVYQEVDFVADQEQAALTFSEFDGGLISCGRQVPILASTDRNLSYDDFCFDNEGPQHQVYIHDFALANRLVTCDEFAAFIADGGYQRSELWLAEGWSWLNQNQIQSPLYWRQQNDTWFEYQLNGLYPLKPNFPVSHVSYYEADAYARWCDCRLPTEFEWEHAATTCSIEAGFLEDKIFQARPAQAKAGLQQMFGHLWQWTSSAYAAYPGYRQFPGALGEYNGKFMSNQVVLRGGSCVTPKQHYRSTYRNFFYTPDRWQFMGIRLVKGL